MALTRAQLIEQLEQAIRAEQSITSRDRSVTLRRIDELKDGIAFLEAREAAAIAAATSGTVRRSRFTRIMSDKNL